MEHVNVGIPLRRFEKISSNKLPQIQLLKFVIFDDTLKFAPSKNRERAEGVPLRARGARSARKARASRCAHVALAVKRAPGLEVWNQVEVKVKGNKM